MKQAKAAVHYPTINPTVPVEAPKPDKVLDIKELEKATNRLNTYASARPIMRLEIANKYAQPEFVEFLLQGEEAYFQSLKNKVAQLIEGATRIA